MLEIPPDQSEIHRMCSYESLCQTFTWKSEEKELNLPRKNGYNLGTICLDEHPPEVMKRTALIWEGLYGEKETYTFLDLKKRSNQVANFFLELGVRRGDRIFFFLDRIPELYIACFAGLKIGAIVAPQFSALGPKALENRIHTCTPKFVVTSVKLKERFEQILPNCPSIEKIVLVDRSRSYSNPKCYEVVLHEHADRQSETFDVPYTDYDDYSVLHFTSGSTGNPKGVVHRHGSVVSQAATAKYILDLRPEKDVFWCTADPGWITGTSYGMIAPWALGCTQLVLRPGFKERCWFEALEKHRVTIWYLSPTTMRMFRKAGEEMFKDYDLSPLRHIQFSGELLTADLIEWSEKAFGLPLFDSWWQTETGCIIIGNYPCMKIKAGSMGRPHPGIEAAVLNDNFEPVANGMEGRLCFRPNVPSFFRTYWNHEEAYQKKIKSGWYNTGDIVRRDDEGYYWFIRRDDDAIISSGHLINPYEIEQTLVEHPAVAEAAVIGVPDPLRTSIIKAFIFLRSGYAETEELKAELQTYVQERLSPHMRPQEIKFTKRFPRTTSGKLKRSVLRDKEISKLKIH